VGHDGPIRGRTAALDCEIHGRIAFTGTGPWFVILGARTGLGLPAPGPGAALGSGTVHSLAPATPPGPGP
jgi:hypothetical protein